jgi:hypothetical protein
LRSRGVRTPNLAIGWWSRYLHSRPWERCWRAGYSPPPLNAPGAAAEQIPSSLCNRPRCIFLSLASTAFGPSISSPRSLRTTMRPPSCPGHPWDRPSGRPYQAMGVERLRHRLQRKVLAPPDHHRLCPGHLRPQIKPLVVHHTLRRNCNSNVPRSAASSSVAALDSPPATALAGAVGRPRCFSSGAHASRRHARVPASRRGREHHIRHGL